MRSQEISISRRHKWIALFLALLVGSPLFAVVELAFVNPPRDFMGSWLNYPQDLNAFVFGATWKAAAVAFLPAILIGRRLLQRPKLDIFRFWFAGVIVGLLPAVVLLAFPLIGLIVVGVALPGILAGSFTGSTAAWLYLRLAGQIPAHAR